MVDDMSTDKENNRAETVEGVVIPAKNEGGALEEQDESPKLPTNPEMEQAVQEAMAALEHKDPKKNRAALEMSQEERDNFRTRIRNLHIELMGKTKELDETKDRMLRVQADLENFRKRAQKEHADMFNYANEEIAKAFLDVLDNLERALKHTDNGTSSSVIDGVKLTVRHMEQLFDRFGVKPIKALGEKFDPSYHQAMSQVFKDDVEPGTVVEEHQRGFMLKDRLLRPSMVVISAKNPDTNTGEVKNDAM